MDHEPTIIDAALKIRDSLRQYAKSKGWTPQKYRILMNVHVPWYAITVVLFSEEFQRINSDQIQHEMGYYNEIMDRLEGDLEESPEIYEALGLLLRPLDEYYIWGYRASAEGIIEIDDSFMNPEVGPEELRGPVGSRM